MNTEYDGLGQGRKLLLQIWGGAPAANAFVAFYKATSGLRLTNERDFISINYLIFCGEIYVRSENCDLD